jgi:hypothetical protein
VLDSSGTIVQYAAGGFNLENLSAGGGLVSSVPDMARFVASFDQAGGSPVLSASSMDTMFALSPLGVNARGFSYGCGWRVYPLAGGKRRIEHDGVLPGSLGFINRLPGGASWVALFNQSYDPNHGDHLQIEGRLNATADAISSWPDNDQFEFFFPTTPSRRFYLIDNSRDAGSAQLFTVDLAGSGPLVAQPLGPRAPYDLEDLAIDPLSGRIYTATGGDTPGSADDGAIFTVDGATGALARLGTSGFSKVTALAIKPTDGSLWGWAEGKGLIVIDTANGEAELFYKSSRKIEGMAWGAGGSTLYIARDKKLYTFDPIKKKLKSVSSKLPRGTEALDALPNGLLLGGADSKAGASIFTFDPTSKRVIQQWPLVAAQGATLSSVEGLAAVPDRP